MTLAPSRHADYGQRWGEGAARCFSIEGDFLDDAQGLRLMPVPDSFFCPISAAIMNDPVATVDGCAYEREYIERWFRERRHPGTTNGVGTDRVGKKTSFLWHVSASDSCA